MPSEGGLFQLPKEIFFLILSYLSYEENRNVALVNTVCAKIFREYKQKTPCYQFNQLFALYQVKIPASDPVLFSWMTCVLDDSKQNVDEVNLPMFCEKHDQSVYYQLLIVHLILFGREEIAKANPSYVVEIVDRLNRKLTKTCAFLLKESVFLKKTTIEETANMLTQHQSATRKYLADLSLSFEQAIQNFTPASKHAVSETYVLSFLLLGLITDFSVLGWQNKSRTSFLYQTTHSNNVGTYQPTFTVLQKASHHFEAIAPIVRQLLLCAGKMHARQSQNIVEIMETVFGNSTALSAQERADFRVYKLDRDIPPNATVFERYRTVMGSRERRKVCLSLCALMIVLTITIGSWVLIFFPPTLSSRMMGGVFIVMGAACAFTIPVTFYRYYQYLKQHDARFNPNKSELVSEATQLLSKSSDRGNGVVADSMLAVTQSENRTIGFGV